MAVLLAGLLMFGTAEEAKAQCTVTFTFCPSDTTFYPPFPPQTCTQIVNWNTPTAENNGDAACGSSNPLTVTQVAGPSPGTPVNVGVYTIIYHAFDANGASASCSFVVTVADTVPPTITGCPADQTKDQEADTCGAHATWLAPVGSDACGIASFTSNTNPLTGQPYASGDFFPVGTTTVIYTATDNSGNTTTCGFDITVNDTSAPVITFCPGDVTQSNDPDSCNAFVTVPDVEIDEDCPATVTYTLTGATTGGPFAGVNASGTYNVGVTTVTFNVDDGSGGTASCSFTVTVEDTQAPVFTVCQADTTVFTSDDGTGDCTTFIITEYEFSENCPGTVAFVEVFLNGSFYGSASGPVSSPFPVGATLFAGINDYTVIITDVAGNADTCTHTVTVIDDEAPTMACSPSGTISTDDTDCFATVLVTAGATDNCAIDFVVNDYNNDSTGSFTDSFPPGSYTITFTAHDTAGNTSSCEATFTVEDDDPPVFTGCVDQTFSADDEFCGAQLEFTAPIATDNCLLVFFERIDAGPGSPDNFGTFPVGTTTVTYFAEDDAGNTATCSFDIIVEDNTAPDVVCPGNVNVNNDPGTCEAVVSIPTFNSTCAQQADFTGYYVFANWTVNTSPGDGSVTPGATTSVTLVSSDNGNGVSTRMNRIIQCDGTVEFDWDYLTTDPDGPFYDPFGYWLNGTFVQLTADGGANAQSGTESIVVSTGDVFAFDQQSDDGLFGPATTTITNFEAPIAIGPSAVDNCGIASIENDFNNTDDASDTYPVGTTTVTWTITDVNGNVTTCSHDVTVNDTEVPVITCDPDKVFNTSDDGTGNCTYFLTGEHVADWTDNCDVSIYGLLHDNQGDTILNATFTGFLAPGGPIFLNNQTMHAGVWTLFLRVEDPSGNRDSCSLNITIIDDEDPTITCPGDIATTAEPDTCGAHISFNVTASDNCYYIITNDFNAQADTNQTQAFNDFVPVGVNTIVFTVTDSAGNTATCDVEITITDDQPPTVICPQLNDQLTSTNDVCYAVVGWADPTEPDSLFDNCAGPIFITQTTGHPNPGVYAVGTYTVEYLAEDQSGNTATCSFTFSVIDTARPEWANCPNDTVVFYDSAQCGQTVVWQAPTPSDNCVGVYDSSTHVPGDFFPVGTTTVVYTAYDSSGNTSQCSFTVTVVDTVPPTIVCQSPDTTLNTDPGECTAVYFYDDPTTSDDCDQFGGTTTFNYGGAPVPIADGNSLSPPDPGPPAIVPISVSGLSGSETLQQACVQISHTFVGDLLLELHDPNGNIVTLLDRPGAPATLFGCGSDDIDACFIPGTGSDAENVCSGTPPAISGNYTATGGNDIATLDIVNGTWELWVYDNTAFDVGTVDGFSLSFSGGFPAVQIAGLPSGSAFPLGTTTNTFIVTDSSGNTATCSFDVTVEDNEDPVFTSCPADMNVGTDPGDCYATVNYTVTATDNCAVTVTQTSGLPSGSQFPIGTTTNSFIATDTAGNTATCSFDVTVTDDEPPTISNCPNDTTVPNEPDMCSAAVSWTAPTVFDNCGIASWTSTHNPGDVFPVGTTTVVYTAEDIYGNTAECTFDVTVEDVQDPIIVCRDTVFENDPGKCYSTQLYDEPYFEDNCPGAYLTHLSGPMQGDTLPVGGPYTVEYMVTDTGGNTATCSFTITVLDTENPTTTCPNDTVVVNDPGVCGAEVTYEPPFPSDNCIVSSVTQIDGTGLTSGDVFPIGTTNQLYVVEDAAGNTITCGFTVTVNDTEPPALNCHDDITVNADTGVCEAFVEIDTFGGSGCSQQNDFVGYYDFANWTVSTGGGDGSATPNGSTEVTLVSSDNGIAASTMMEITIPCDGTVNFDWDYETTDVDGPSFDPFGYWLNGVFTQLTNDAGPDIQSGSVSIPVSGGDVFAFDQQSTDGDFGAATTVSSSFSAPVSSPGGGPTATDNCGIASIVNDYNGTDDATDTYPVGTTTVTWTVTDVNGNTSTCSFTVTVVDDQSPTITCPADITVSNDPGLCEAVVTYPYPATDDNCFMEVAFYDFETGPQGWTTGQETGSTNNFWNVYNTTAASGNNSLGTANDGSLNVPFGREHSFMQSPPFEVNGGMVEISFETFINNEDGTTFDVEYIEVSTDGGATWTIVHGVPEPGLHTGVTTSTWTPMSFVAAGAPAGTQTMFRFRYDTGDDFGGAPDGPPIGWYVDNVSISASSPIPTQTAGLPSGSSFPVGTTTNVFMVTDNEGHTATCSFDVTVEDNEDPVISGCPVDITVSNDPGSCDAVVSWTAPTVTDNCAVTSWTSSHNPGDVFPVGTTSVVYTAEDAAGNVTTCGFDVTVEDNEAPVASCPADMTVSNDPGNCDAVVTWSFQATDNCGVASINSTHNSGDVFPIGTTTVMYTVEDVNGNTATCSFDVTVEDNEAPTITCPADMTVSNDPGVCGAVVNYSYTASDNCPGEVVTITSGMASGSQFPVGTTTVTLVVTDASGNTAECSFDVTVEDNEAPTVDCPADTTLSTDPGVCETAFSYVVPFADNCPDATISYIGGGGMSTNIDIDTSYVMYASSGALGGQLHRVDAASGSSFVVGALGNYGPVRTIDWDQGASIAAGTGGGACNSILIDKWTATETLVGNDPNCVQSNFSYEWINGTLYAVQIDTNTALETIHVQDFTGQNGKGATGGTPMTIDLSGVNWTIDVSGTSMPNSGDWFRVENERMEANDVDGPAIWYSEAIDITTYSSVNFSLLATETGDLEPTDYMDIAYSTDGGSTWTMINNWNGLGSATHTFVGDLPDDDDWESETVSVSGLSGSSLMVRVTMFNDNDSPGEPMQIDDLMVTGNPYWVATLGTVSGGALTPVATITPPNTFPIDGMAYNPNTDVLYTIAANDLYTLNRNTGALTFVGSTGASDLRTLDYNPGDGMLYAGSHSGGIYTIDPGTGAATLLSSTGLTISSLTWVELITISSDVTVSGTYPLGTTTEEFFVVDASGNTTSCSFTITVEDNELPTISCPADINVYAGPDQCDALVNYVTPIISDNCPGASVSLVSGLGSGSMFPVGTTTELWMVTDGSGNTATCSFTVSVADTQAPTIQCVPDITVANDTGLCGATVAFTQTIVLLEQDFESWPCCLSNPNGSATYDGWFNANGFTTPDWSVDNNGTSSGFTGPSVDHTLGTSSGMYVYLETSTGAGTGSFDILYTPAIDLSTVSTAEVSFWYHMYGATMGTLRLEASANGSTWTQVFSISGPQHFSGTDPWTQATVNLNTYAGGTVFLRFVGIRGTSFTGDMAIDDILVTGQQGITIADNCPGATFTQIGGIPSGGFFPVGTTTNTFMVTDASGNTATCSFDVTVEDTEPPVFTSGVGGGIPVPTTLLDEDFNGCAQPGGWTSNIINGVDPWLFGDNGGDNLDGTCMAYFDDDAIGSGAPFSTVELVSPTMDMTNIVSGQLTFDYNFRALGSSSFTVDGWDGSSWVNLLTETSNNVGSWFSGPPYASANLSLAGFTNPDFQLRFEYHDGSTWAWYVGFDNVVVSGGIFMECEQDSITVLADSALCGADVIVAIPTAMDNCAIDTITNDYNGTGDASDFYPVGTTTVTWTAYDESGNTATCTQVITVIDDQDPTIACPADIVVANDSGSCDAFVTVPAPVTTDNCTVTVTNDYNGTADASDVYPVGTTTVVFTVVDEGGNTATCSMEITVEDTEAPTITCPNDLTVPTDPGLCGAVVIYNFPTFNDNCPGATVTLVQGQGPVSLFPVGTTTNIFRVEDAAGNTATCSFTVTVEDVEAPTFIDCPANILVSNDPGDCGAIVTWIEPTAIDNCPDVTVTGSAAPGDFFPVGTTTVVYTATDDAGNTATCTFTISVEDTEAPVITGCPADIQSCDPVVTWTAPTATDNCNVASFTSTHTSGSTFPIGTTTVVYTATDDAGNVTTCGFDVTIHPLPTADAGPDVDVCTGLSVTIGGNPTASGTVGPYTYSWVPAGSLDDPTLANPSASPTATTTYTVTITDANGCTDTDEVTVTVNPLPTADAGADQAICLNESTTIGGNPTASGTVGPYTYSWAPATGLSTTNAANPTASPTATTTYTVTVTDANGCESTDVVTVTVNPLPDATITPAGPFCENDGSQTLTAATAGGTWSGNGITNASAGTFNPGVAGVGTHQITYTVTDANGCSNSATTLIEVLAIPDARILPAGPFCEDDDPVFLTGLPNITPSTWSGPGVGANGQFDPSAAGAGSHVITYMVTNANGCSDTTTLTIVVNAMPSVVLQTGSPFCELDPVVTFTASVPGGIWSGPGIIQPQLGQFLPIAAGAGVHDIDYTVTNANGCTVTETVLITVFEVPAITSIVTEASCSDASDGAINITVTGGTQPYTYAWSNGATTEDLTGIGPGTYTVTVSDQNLCTQTASITVGVSTTPVVAQAVIKPANNAATPNGEISLNVSGGVPPYDFLWSNGEITKDIDSLLPGNYTVVIIDDAGCSYTFTYNVPARWPVGIDIDQLDKNIRLFPNPTSDVINIEIEVGAVDADMTMTVYDVLGRKLYEVHDGFSGAYQHQIDMRNWAAGHYMIRFDINGQQLTKKFILAK